MTFKWLVPGHLAGSQQAMECVDISLFQHLHRQLGMAPEPHGAGHEEQLDWRRDKPVPQRSVGKTCEFTQFYLDDFDCPELVPKWQLGGVTRGVESQPSKTA